MSDEIERGLRALPAQLPAAETGLSESAKDALIQAVGGPRTATSIIQAQASYPLARIPFLFSSLDTQCVINLLNNDMSAAIDRARAAQEAKKREKKLR